MINRIHKIRKHGGFMLQSVIHLNSVVLSILLILSKFMGYGDQEKTEGLFSKLVFDPNHRSGRQ